MSTPLRVGILASTKGTILPAVIQNCSTEVDFVVFVTDKADCGARAKASELGIPTETISSKDKTRENWDAECLEILQKNNVELVILVGFMRILTNVIIDPYQNRILNVHPSLLPKYAGAMNIDVHQAVIDAHESESGATIHFVTEGVDEGAILLQQKLPVAPHETAESLKIRVQELEKKLYPEAIHLYAKKLSA